METRICCSCEDEKPISGVWYLLADGSGAFMCGSCFYDEESLTASSARGSATAAGV